MEMDRIKEFLRIDLKMLPIKLHFFLYALAISAVMSYFPIMVKNIGISATAVGIIYTISPFTTVLANPLFGWITDRLQKVKLVIVIMIIIQTPLFIGTVFVTPLSVANQSFPVELSCTSNYSYAVTSSKFHDLKQNSKILECKSNCEECLHLTPNGTYYDMELCGKNIKLETEELFNTSSNFLTVANISVNGTQLPTNCYKNPSNECHTVCTVETGEGKESEFATYQFWTLLVLLVSSLVLANSSIAIADAACYEALRGKVNQFGKQRVWLSIGWGLGTMMTGFLLDLTNTNNDVVDFSYCAYVMLILIIFDLIALSQANLIKPGVSKNIFKDVGKVFARPHPIIFISAALIIGSLSGIQWNYMFWYLEGMGASKFLLGLSMAVLCVLVEAPFMFISGWIVKRIGRDNTMVLAFSAFAVWFLSISYISNPWWILLIAFSQGPSYGLFYVAMTSYGKIATAPGTEATMQTVLGAVFHGLGIGSGSLICGLGFDLYGGKMTYRFSGYFSIGLAIVYKFLTTFVAGEESAFYKETSEPIADNKEKKLPKIELYSVS